MSFGRSRSLPSRPARNTMAWAAASRQALVAIVAPRPIASLAPVTAARRTVPGDRFREQG